MFLISQKAVPAAKACLAEQMSYFNDVCQSVSRSYQQLGELNMQLMQTMMEESRGVGLDMVALDKPLQVFTAIAAHAQPAADKLQAYQRHLTRLAADSQVEVARLAEEHIPQASRTARALAEDVAQAGVDEVERGMREQREALNKFKDPFERRPDGQQGAARGGQGRDTEAALGEGRGQEAALIAAQQSAAAKAGAGKRGEAS